MRIRRSEKSSRLVSLFKVIIVLFLLLGVFYVLKNREFFSSVIAGEGRSTVLLYSGKDGVLMVEDTHNPSLTFILIPSELYLEVPGGYGDYRFGSIFKLGEIDGIGEKLVKITLENSFAIPVDVVRATSESLDFGKGGDEDWKKIKARFEKTDIRLWWRMRGVKPSAIKVINLRSSDSVSELVLPDNSKALKINNYIFDKEIAESYLKDGLIVSDNLKAEILNSSDISGLAERASRYLSNMGIAVLAVGNSDTEINECELEFDQKRKNDYSIIKLLKSFNCRPKAYTDLSGRRADLTLIIGGDFLKD